MRRFESTRHYDNGLVLEERIEVITPEELWSISNRARLMERAKPASKDGILAALLRLFRSQ
jgi:hypothetical protein